MKWHFVKNKTVYTASLKNAINLLVVYLHKMNFKGCCFMCVHICECRSFKN